MRYLLGHPVPNALPAPPDAIPASLALSTAIGAVVIVVALCSMLPFAR